MKQLNDFIAFHGVEIEVIAVAASCPGQPVWIDVVRAFLVGLHVQAASMQGSAQTYGDRGFTGGLSCSGDKYARHRHVPLE